jgi:4'-phosphopantetheinyl transferase
MTIQTRPPCAPVKGVALHLCRLDDDATIPLDEAAALLSPTEAARAARFHFPRDRVRFIRGRGFLRRVLAAATGYDAAALPLVTGTHGKPALALTGAPGFNLSHAGALAVLALRAGGPVGIDLEAATPARDHSPLYDTCLAPEEAAHLRALPAALQPRAFLACWTAKEAVMKLLGTGLSLPPSEVLLDLKDGIPQGARMPAARLVAVPVPDHLCHIALPPEPETSQ